MILPFAEINLMQSPAGSVPIAAFVGLLRMLQAGVILSDDATLMVEILKDNLDPTPLVTNADRKASKRVTA